MSAREVMACAICGQHVTHVHGQPMLTHQGGIRHRAALARQREARARAIASGGLPANDTADGTRRTRRR